MGSRQPSTVEAIRVARTQDGLLTRQQAALVGVSRSRVRHLVRSGRWQLALPRVYTTFSGPIGERQLLRAALLYASPGAQLTAATSCRLHGLKYVPGDRSLVHVLVDERRQVASVAFVRVHRTTQLPTPHTKQGLPVTPVARAAVDACRDTASLRDVRALLCEVVQRGLSTADRLSTAIGAGHSAGSALPRRALADVVGGCRSAPECELLDLLSRSWLPAPAWNLAIRVGPGGDRAVPDARWAEAGLVVEVDSAEWHDYGESAEQTRRRHARLAAMGWTVIPVSPRRLREEPAMVLAEIEAAYLLAVRLRAAHAPTG